MSLRALAAVGVVLISCADPSDSLRPRVQVPPASSDAYPYAVVETLELSIARAGSSESLALVSANIDDDLQLDGVPYGDDLVVHLSGRAGSTEVAYGRTCSVDVAAGTPVLEPYLYFSRLVRWGAGPRLTVARGAGLRMLGLGPRVLLVGGGGGQEVEVLDIRGVDSSEQSLILPAKLAIREGASLEAFGPGALLLGGSDEGGAPLGTIELIAPTEENVGSQVLTLDGPLLVEHASVALEDGSVLASGGRDLGGLATSAAYRFSELDAQVVTRNLGPGLLTPRRLHSMTRLGNEVGADVLVLGGLDDAGLAVAQAELFRPLRSTFETVEGALLQFPRYGHRAVRLPGGFVLVIGGLSPGAGGAAEAVRELELYDPGQGVFASAGILPSGAGLTGMSVTELPDGRFMIAGGLDIDGAPVASVLIARFNPIDGVVDLSPTDSLELARTEHSAVLLCDGSVLVAGGTLQSSSETERYSPPAQGRR